MIQMRDSTLPAGFLEEAMKRNPPRKLENGNIFSGIVRLTFPNLFKPRENKNQEGGEGKFGAGLLFPLGADLTLLANEWTAAAKEHFAKHWTPQGPVGLHSPFHDQIEKTTGVKAYSGYTPGAIYINVASRFRPQVVDGNFNPIVDESRIYPGVWCYVALNTYKYDNNKKGVGFGLQSVMFVADDQKLGGGGSDPKADFGGVTIMATSNVADKFNSAPVLGQTPANVFPNHGFVGQPGSLPVTPLPGAIKAEDLY